MAPKLFQSVMFDLEDGADYENIEDYKVGGLHPVCVGDVFENGRFTVVHKLGSGGYATVWLAFDAYNKKYAALKVLSARSSNTKVDYSKGLGDLSNGADYESDACVESKIINLLRKTVDEEGRKRLAVEVERFWVEGSNGKHLFLVSEVNGPNLQDVLWDCEYGPDWTRKITLETVEAMRSLHKAGVVHGDFSTRNILLKLENIDDINPADVEQCFGPIVKEELLPQRSHDPKSSAPKWIFKDAEMINIPPAYIKDEIKVIDFGFSHRISKKATGGGPPFSYRAPELMGLKESRRVLQAGYHVTKKTDEKVDIWALACVIFEVQTSNQLFVGRHQDWQAIYDIRDTMRDLWAEDDDKWVYIRDKEGKFKKGKTLMEKISYLRDDMSKPERDSFYDLLRKMLKRNASDRIGIEQVIEHPWIRTNFGDTKMTGLGHESEESLEE